MKQASAWLLLLSMIITLAGCAAEEITPPTLGLLEMEKASYIAAGMEIQLPTEFRALEGTGYTVCYEASTAAVFALREGFDLAAGVEDLTLAEYADLVRVANTTKSPSEVKEEDGLMLIEYTFFVESQNADYVYLTTMFKTSDAFWMIQFTCQEENYETYRPHFIEWAKSVTFAPEA